MRNLLPAILLALLVMSAGCGKQGPESGQRSEGTATKEEILTGFHKLWYHDPNTWQKNQWLGIPTLQSPLDVWITQEVIFDIKPDVILECGAFHGGSAALWAMILREVNPDGRVISIDIEDRLEQARGLSVVKERVEFIIGSSTDPEVVAQVKEKLKDKKVFIILDSDHKKQHVLDELNAYWELVPVGGYIHVQDTVINGNPLLPEYGPGPMEAVEEFLETNSHFEIDKSRERLLFTLHPNGWLKRID